MSLNEYAYIRNIAKQKILVCRVLLGNEVAKISGRFGSTFDCGFNETSIVLSYTRVSKFVFMNEYDEVIEYNKVEEVEFSLVKRPIRNVLEHGHYYALDIIIRLKNGVSYHLETFAFKFLEQIKLLLETYNVKIIDNLSLIEKYSGLDIEEVKVLISPIYDSLALEYNLESIRTLDNRK